MERVERSTGGSGTIENMSPSSPSPDSTPVDPTPTGEILLEPIHLIEKSNAIMRLGRMMLQASSSSFRVKQAMSRAAQALGMTSLHTQITATEIVCTFFRGTIFRTRVAEARVGGVDADRIVELERLSHHMPQGMLAEELNRRLDVIEKRPRHYPTWLTLIAAIMACSGFAFLNNGGWQECVGVALSVSIAQWLRVTLVKLRINQLAMYAVCGLIASLCYVLFTGILSAVSGHVSPLHDAGFTSALLLLVPGFPLVTATLDLARLDLNSAIGRLTFAGLVLMSVSFGAWAVAMMFDLQPTAAPTPSTWPVWVVIASRLVAGFVAVTGFAMMFNTPFRLALSAAGIGAIANVFRLTTGDMGWPPQVSTVVAALLVGLLAYMIASRLDAPRITLTVPAVLIMVPGSSAYRALVYLNQGDIVQAGGYGVQALATIVSLAVGLTIARMLTEREWSFDALRG